MWQENVEIERHSWQPSPLPCFSARGQATALTFYAKIAETRQPGGELTALGRQALEAS